MTERRARASRPTLLCLCVLASTACVSSGPERRNVADGDGPWIDASPVLEAQIRDEAERLPWTHGFERLEQIRWFAAVGEPAYPTLIELVEDPRADVAAAALAALGATLDRSLVPHVRTARLAAEPGSDLWLERARTLVRLGDWSEIPVLIEGLSDERLYTRSLCLDALREVTHETHGFDARAGEQARREAIDRWHLWWSSRSEDLLLRGPS